MRPITILVASLAFARAWLPIVAPGRFSQAARIRTRLAAASETRWFDPIAEFGPLDEPRPDPATLPLLLMLPGLDGSSVTGLVQFAELAQA